jgi:predicted transcriptional regulator
MKDHLTLRIDRDLKAQLSAVAKERNTSASAILTLALQQFLNHETVIGEMLNMEQRLAATVIRTLSETARVEDDVQLVIAQLDQLIRFVFQATPEIFDKESAGIIGARRYSGFLESFAEQFQSRKRRAVFATKVDELHPLDDD